MRSLMRGGNAMRHLRVIAALVVVLFTAALLTAEAAVKSFPTAEGFGASSRGGRGGRVIKVTNLNDRGPGSLRACMENTGPRTCLFTVGGTIALHSNIRVSGPSMSYLTVAGQTAPGDGIQIKNYGIWLTSGVHDVILRFLRIRHGHDATPDLYQNGFNFLAYEGNPAVQPYNIILDHMSLQWGTYINVEFSGAYNWTTQWSLIGPSENAVDYVDPQGDPASSYGFVMGSYSTLTETGTLHHNILTGNEARSPLIGRAEVFDMVNNIMFNWYGCTYGTRFHEFNEEIFGAQVNANLINNIWLHGPAQTGCILGTIDGDGSARDPNPQIYLSGIRTPFCGGASCNNPTLNEAGFRGSDRFGNSAISDADFRVYSPFPAPPVTVTPLNSLESTLVANVGATKPARDSLDTLYLTMFTSRQGHGGEQPTRRCMRCGQVYPSLANGPAPTDTDGDGIPDAWESAHGLNPRNSADGARTAANGYTDLENYLNELAGDTAPAGDLPTLAAPPHEFSPASGPPGATVSINGRNLAAAPVTVTFGATPARVLSTRPTRITAAVPAMSPGAVVVTVTTAGGAVSSQNTFQVKPRRRH
jgi:pectate lyase